MFISKFMENKSTRSCVSSNESIKGGQGIGMWKFKEEEKDCNYNHFWVCGLFGN